MGPKTGPKMGPRFFMSIELTPWLGSSLNQIQGWTTVRESYSHALEQGPLLSITSPEGAASLN